MTPDFLPKFTIGGIYGEFCAGRFEPSPWAKEGSIAVMIAGNLSFIWGQFRRIDSVESTCEFHPDEGTDWLTLESGRSYPYMDSYWGQRAELVLDHRRQWKETAFEPSDMIVFPVESGGSLGTRLSPKAPSGGEIVEGGWDHEHCDICWNRIGCGGEKLGYYSDPSAWVCGECYTKHVAPQSIAFEGMGREWFS